MDKSQLKIGIDARFWSQTGVGRYIRHIVGELAKLDDKNRYIVYLLNEDVQKVSLPENFKIVGTDIRWHTLAEQISLPLRYLRDNLDVLVVLNFNIPILYPKKIVTTVHDLTLLRTRTGRATRLPYPVYLIKFLAGCLTHYLAVKKSKKIFTVSKYVKNDIIKTFKIDPQKIVLTPNAVDESFYPRSAEEVTAVLQKYGIKQPYLFYVGNACLHKNLWRLMQAFEVLAKTETGLTLVLGGRRDFNYERLQSQFAGLARAKKIILPGFIDDTDLPALYSGASLYVNPSMYEGFGIQTLEAFACGCRVVCSNSTSLPEVGGDLADYFEPKNIEDMAKVIKESLHKVVPDFVNRARGHVTKYSWRDSAKSIYNVLVELNK